MADYRNDENVLIDPLMGKPTEELILITRLDQLRVDGKEAVFCFKGHIKKITTEHLEVKVPTHDGELVMDMKWLATGVYEWKDEAYGVFVALDTAKNSQQKGAE